MDKQFSLERPIKLIFAISLFEINGACAVAKNLIDNLNSQNFEIILLTERIAERHFEFNTDIKIINLDIEPQKGFLKKLLNIRKHMDRIKKTILVERPDIVLSFGTLLNCYLLLALNKKERKDIKIIISEHSENLLINYSQPIIKEKILRKLYKMMMYLSYGKADSIIAVSENIASDLRKLLGKEEKIKVIYNPVDISKIKKLSGESITDCDFNENIPNIVAVSRLSPEKGISSLIKAFANLILKIDARLIIIGDGEERSRLEALAKRHNIENKIKFLGWQENPFKFLKKAEVFALSSFYEGFPNVILEAMACGVPVVTLKSGRGIEEIIEDGVDGIIVDSRDPEVLSDRIHNLLVNKALRERIAMEAYKKLDRFAVSKIVKEYEDIMIKLFSNN